MATCLGHHSYGQPSTCANQPRTQVYLQARDHLGRVLPSAAFLEGDMDEAICIGWTEGIDEVVYETKADTENY